MVPYRMAKLYMKKGLYPKYGQVYWYQTSMILPPAGRSSLLYPKSAKKRWRAIWDVQKAPVKTGLK